MFPLHPSFGYKLETLDDHYCHGERVVWSGVHKVIIRPKVLACCHRLLYAAPLQCSEYTVHTTCWKVASESTVWHMCYNSWVLEPGFCRSGSILCVGCSELWDTWQIVVELKLYRSSTDMTCSKPSSCDLICQRLVGYCYWSNRFQIYSSFT